MKSPSLLLVSLLSLAAIALPLPAKSATITESFSSPAGGVPSEWTAVIRSNAVNNGVVEVAPVPETSQNALRFHRAANGSSGNFGGNANAAVYYTGAEGSQITDFTAEVTLRLEDPLGVSSSIGVMLRTQSLAYQFSKTPFSSYYVAITSSGLGIYENPTNNNNTELGVLLSNLSAVSLEGDVDYLFRVSAQGATLSASLWDASGSVELASAMYSSANVVEGYFGFRSGFGNYSTTAYFRDLTLTVIPEPASLLLMGIGGFVVLRLRSRKRGPRNQIAS